MARRKVTYPPPKTANRPAPPTGLPDDAPYVRPTVAIIDLNAGKGRTGLSVGGRVRITGTGLYSGEIAVIERRRWWNYAAVGALSAAIAAVVARLLT